MKITKTQLKQMIEEEISGLDEGFLDTMKDIQSAMGFGRSTEVEPSAPAAPVDPKVACKSECDAKFQDAIAKTDGQARFSRKYHKCMEYCVAEKARPAAPVQRDTGQTSGCNCNTLHMPGTKCGKICAKRLGVEPNAPLSREDSPEEKARLAKYWADQREKDKQARADRKARSAATDPSGLSAKGRAQRDACSARGLRPGSRDCKNYLAGLRSIGRAPGQYVSEGIDLYGIIEEELSAVLAEMKD